MIYKQFSDVDATLNRLVGTFDFRTGSAKNVSTNILLHRLCNSIYYGVLLYGPLIGVGEMSTKPYPINR